MDEMRHIREHLDYHRGDAVISDCDAYRYRLNRVWNLAERQGLLFVMLNPSTADANVDDATIRRCTGFAKKWGYGGFNVVNLFAFRATDPRELLSADDPIGPDNDQHISEALANSDRIVCAWGANKAAKTRATRSFFRNVLWHRRGLHCLALNKDGSPKHPLYVPSDAKLVRFDPPSPQLDSEGNEK